MSGRKIDSENKILNVVGLTKYYPIAKGFFQRVVGHVRAVDDVSLYVNAGGDSARSSVNRGQARQRSAA